MEIIGDLRGYRKVVNFEWKIQDFLQLSHEADAHYQSPTFSFLGVSWAIQIYPNGQRIDESVGYISLYVTPMSLNVPISVDYSLQFKTFNGKVGANFRYIHIFDKSNYGHGPPKLISRSELINRKSILLPSGALTVICTLMRSNRSDEFGCATVNEFTQMEEETGYATVDEFTQTEEETASTAVHSTCKVFQDFKELYLKRTGCDVVIKVQGQEFPAHQAFLKARSPVLCSTFQTDMKEKATGVVEIDDCDPSFFSDFLCFLYCGEVEILSVENVFSLFTIADKYDVVDLRAPCLTFIKDNLTVNTFCDTISLALLHSEAELIKLCTDFFAKNIPKIILTVKWQTFLAENPTESNELLIKALVPNKNSDYIHNKKIKHT